ncbi:MAG: ATP-dependent zinc metalloprotease FtsH, partial [Ruminococcus sp.]|nr:ATP-dependent zinc metalloprotease FtsH [Ruminococcus sp.]
MNKNNNGKSLLIYLLVSVAIIGGLVYFLTSMSTNNTSTKYSEVMSHFDKLEISEFELDLGSGKMKYKLKNSDETKNYTVPNVSIFAQEVLGGEDAENYRKKYNEANPDEPLKYNLIPISDNSFWLNMIPTLLMLGVMIFFFVFMMKNAGGGKMSSFGKTNAKQAPS